jgi:hypothetical protein
MPMNRNMSFSASLMDNVHKLFLQNLDGFVEVVTLYCSMMGPRNSKKTEVYAENKVVSIKKTHALMQT